MRKICPFCSEPIKATAIKCKHCGSDLSELIDKENKQAKEKKQIQSQQFKTLLVFFLFLLPLVTLFSLSFILGVLYSLGAVWGFTSFYKKESLKSVLESNHKYKPTFFISVALGFVSLIFSPLLGAILLLFLTWFYGDKKLLEKVKNFKNHKLRIFSSISVLFLAIIFGIINFQEDKKAQIIDDFPTPEISVKSSTTDIGEETEYLLTFSTINADEVEINGRPKELVERNSVISENFTLTKPTLKIEILAKNEHKKTVKNLVITRNETEAEKQEREALELAKKKSLQEARAKKDEEQRLEKIKSQFSAWDGSHINFTRQVKSELNDPQSFEHVETTYFDQGDHLTVVMRFRGKNAFGGVVANTLKGKISLSGEVLDIFE